MANSKVPDPNHGTIESDATLSLDRSYLVLSGPGTGKTRIVVSRLESIVNSSVNKTGRVLALTFTNKAAGEMQRRISSVLPIREEERIFVGTFHAFGSHVLRSHGNVIGIPPDFILYDEDDRVDTVRRLQERGLIPGEPAPDAIARLIDRAKSRLAGLGQSVEEPGATTVEIRDTLTSYQSALKQQGALDFTDLIYRLNLLFASHPEILRLYRMAYHHVLVDEFQDTTPGQYQILKSIVDPGRSSLFAVADEDQLIFEWNDARIDRLNSLISDFHPEVIFSSLSYRCPPRIVAAANAVIIHNRLRFPNKPPIESRASRLETGSIILASAENPEVEGKVIAQAIEDAHRAGAPLAECAIIARAGWALESLEKALASRRIASGRPSVGGLGEDEDADILIRFLRWVLNPRDAQSARRVMVHLSPAIFEVSERQSNTPEFEDVPYEQVLAELAHQTESPAALLPFLESVARLRLGLGNSRWLLGVLPGELEATLPSLVDDSKIVAALVEKARSLSDFGSRSRVHGRMPLSDFLLNLPKVVANGTRAGDAVSVLTYHQAKGLEFDQVFLVGLEQGLLPDYRAEGHSRALEEERRLFYVGLTRSKANLHLSYCRGRPDIRGIMRPRQPSMFLSEIPNDLIQAVDA